MERWRAAGTSVAFHAQDKEEGRIVGSKKASEAGKMMHDSAHVMIAHTVGLVDSLLA